MTATSEPTHVRVLLRMVCTSVQSPDNWATRDQRLAPVTLENTASEAGCLQPQIGLMNRRRAAIVRSVNAT